MAESREQRLQMRQRGAATRQTKEVDFGFTFGTPSTRSRTTTPTSSRRLSRRIAQQSQSRRSSARAHSVSDSGRRSNTPLNGEQQDEVSNGGSNKRPRLDAKQKEPQNSPSSTPIKPLSSASRESIRTRLRTSIDASAIQEESIQEESEPSNVEKTNVGNVLSESTVNMRARETIGPGRGFSTAKQDDASKLSISSEKENDRADSPENRALSATTPERAQKPVRKSGRRKSTGREIQRRVSSGSLPQDGPDTVDLPPTVQEETHLDVEKQRGSEDLLHPVPEEMPSHVDVSEYRERDMAPRRSRRNSLVSSSSDESEYVPEIEVEVEVRNSSRPDETPIVGKGRKKKDNQFRKRRRDVGDLGDRDQSAKDVVPIQVHRLAQATLLVQDDDDELTQSRDMFPNRGGVNAADVLAQVWRETATRTIETLTENVQKERARSRKEELKRKAQSVAYFGSEVDGKLFDLSEALDYNFLLSTRLKRANKEKNDLREEFLRIGREREELTLKMDEVRRRHQEDSQIAEEHNELNNTLHDLDLALQRDRTRGGLEFLLRTVTNDASMLGDSGGLLQQVRGLNDVLEKAALALEGR